MRLDANGLLPSPEEDTPNEQAEKRLTEAPLMLQALVEVVAMSDPQGMQEIAHRMNDAVSHVGGAAIRDITRAIAQDAQNEDFLAAQRHFDQLQSEIQQWLAQSR